MKNAAVGVILGIDPGTRCGWALRSASGVVASGVWNLAPGRHEGGGMRFVRLRSYLSELFGRETILAVGYEEVRRHMGVDAAHIYGGIVLALTGMCEERNTPYRGIPVATVKKLATGKGNADKAAMIAAAVRQWPQAVISDDNEADARWIAETLWRELHPMGATA